MKITKKKGGASAKTTTYTPRTLNRRSARRMLNLGEQPLDVVVDEEPTGTIRRSGPGLSAAAPKTLIPFTERQIEDFFIEKKILFKPKNAELIKFYVIYQGRKKFFNLEIQYLLNDYYRRSEPDSNNIDFKVNGLTISFSLDKEDYYVVFIGGIKFGELQYDISKSDSGNFVNFEFFDFRKSKYLLGQNSSFHNDLRKINEEKKELEKSKKNIEKETKQAKPALERLKKTIRRLEKISDKPIDNIINRKEYQFQNLYSDFKHMFLPLKILSRYNKTKTYRQYCDELEKKIQQLI